MLLAAPDCVFYSNPQFLILAFNLYRLHLYQVTQPLLQRTLHKHLGGGGKLGAVWGENELH